MKERTQRNECKVSVGSGFLFIIAFFFLKVENLFIFS